MTNKMTDFHCSLFLIVIRLTFTIQDIVKRAVKCSEENITGKSCTTTVNICRVKAKPPISVRN